MSSLHEFYRECLDLNHGLVYNLCLGSWRRHLVVTEDQVLKIPAGLPVDAAATVSVNPCTAFRMLKDFEDLGPGNYKIHWLRWLQYFKKGKNFV